jgi:hypothetical protein
MKPCQGRDEMLLMLAHGQLGLVQRVKTSLHARNCPHCKARLARYAALSGGLSVVLASAAGPRWLPPIATMRIIASRGAIVGGIVVLLILGLWTMRRAAEANEPPPMPKPGTTGPGHCGMPPPVKVSPCGEKKSGAVQTSQT